MARPTKYTIELAKRICAHIRDGANREDAAQACGVCSSTLANWMDKHPQFSAWVMEADSQSTIGAEAKAYERDPVRWLQAKRPLIWGNLGKQAADDMLEKSLTAVNTLLARLDTAPSNAETADDLGADTG